MRISGSFEPKKEQCGRVKRPNTAYAGCFFIITKVISDVYAAEKQGFKPLDPFHKLTNYALFLRYDSKMRVGLSRKSLQIEFESEVELQRQG